jgi:diaminopimelate decarboxylase
MDHASALIYRYFSSSDGELLIGGVPVSAIVARQGTPFFVYDASVLDQKWNLLRRTFPSEFAISYSVKANPNPVILKHFLAKGCGLEIASGGEFYLALQAGCPPEKILFAGPGKTESELELVLANGVGEIHVESLLELERLSGISRRIGRRPKVCVRVNPGSAAQGGAMRMGGKSLPFGIDEESLEVVLERILSDPSLELRGIHLFTGTQILDYTTLVRQYRKGLEIARRVASWIRRPFETVDFGGGLGTPYFGDEQELNMEKLREELTRLMAEVRSEPLLNGTKFVVEPGRYLVGEAGIYVTRVNDIKVSRGKKFVIVDGGMNHHLAASGNLGQVIKRNFPVAILSKLEEKQRETVDIVGPLCTPLDLLARSADLPPANVGDLVGLFQSGAYARTASPLGFLSHRTPAEVFVEQGNVRLIRRSGTYEDLLRDIP